MKGEERWFRRPLPQIAPDASRNDVDAGSNFDNFPSQVTIIKLDTTCLSQGRRCHHAISIMTSVRLTSHQANYDAFEHSCKRYKHKRQYLRCLWTIDVLSLYYFASRHPIICPLIIARYILS